MTGVAQIDRDELRELLESGGPVFLVDALSPMSYAHSHLPGAINLIPERVDDEARRRLPDLDAEIVVYCASETCDSSVDVARRLVALGYRRVRHYPGGKREWTESGLPLEGRARAAR